MRKQQIKQTALCAALCGALLLTACSPAVHLATRVLTPSETAFEEDPRLVEELALSISREEGLAGPMADYQAPAATALEGGLPDLAGSLRFMAAQVKSLRIPDTFAVTRPASKLTTSYATYYIMGTSDPSQPVYFGNTEIQRQGSKGAFGVHVNLGMGANSFTFSQGGKTQTVSITRTAQAGQSAIREIRQDSMVPAIHAGVKAGEKLSVGCVAPSGATVKASYNGSSVTLKQADESVRAGMPAAFTGKITVDPDGYDPETTAKGEPVAYAMSYNGSSKSYTSTGAVYVAGEDSRIAVEITSYLGFIYPDTKNLATFKETVKDGARDYIAGQTNEYYELATGGFVPKGQTKVVTGAVRVSNKLNDVAFSRSSKSEKFVFSGTRKPVYDTWISDNTLYFRLYNTSGTPKPDTGDSRLVSSCSISEGESRVTYKFPLKGLVWGYDVAFDENDIVLTLKYKPSLGSGSTPFEGMTILLDPGHGGTDPGALGFAGGDGPTEDDVNLANAQAAQNLLESMGAKVVMTRTGDTYLSLDDRLQMIEDNRADFFISIHHNSVAESSNGNTAKGMEIYYHTALSKKFASNMMTGLTGNLDRNNRGVFQSYYRVTLMPYAPALLLELGFMPNPLEYERACSSAEMNKVAQAIADGIVNTLK